MWSFDTPLEPNSFPKSSGPRKSRFTWSWRSFCQSKPIAPGMWASAYSAGFSSTSTIRIESSSRWSSTHCVSTRTSFA